MDYEKSCERSEQLDISEFPPLKLLISWISQYHIFLQDRLSSNKIAIYITQLRYANSTTVERRVYVIPNAA